MATTANLSSNGDDPFVNSNPTQPSPHRYASFDNQVFSLYNSGSPAQAKRALEAHLKDTERRIQDASKLGTTLLQQRKDLAARLKEVEDGASEDITPELQKKLDQLEKDYTEIGKDTARAFLPKSRIVSTDFSVAPPSPAVFVSDSRPSPVKRNPTEGSRRQRNQPTNRVHDIEFATEISTSLLAQVRQLQAVLAEKENALKDATTEKEQLETDIGNLMQRLRMLDESEQKCKDENWNLETQMQELTAQLKEATDKEQRLSQQLKFAQAEKDTAQRDLEDLKAAHGKLSDDHESVKKHHEAELFTLRRDVTSHQTARDALLKKVEELTSQNTQLAKAVAARWNADSQPQDTQRSLGRDNGDSEVATPDVSPQNSPVKPTPRHGMLETETLKSSLTHAHRMIQNLKNNIHREKTEKFELKRLLQDARDELENKRTDGGIGQSVSKKRRSDDSGIKFNKGARADKLGASRAAKHEIIMDDDEWEDQSLIESPSRPATRNISSGIVPFGNFNFGRTAGAFGKPESAETTDAFETADERGTTDAFETANEDDDNTNTETEGAFQTGAETIDGDSSDDLTETEFSPVKNQGSSSRPVSRPGPHATNKAENRLSFMSTASTSADEFENIKTPIQGQQPRYKLRLSKGRRSTNGSARNSAVFASDDSPASQASQRTPVQFGQSLSAELDGLSNDSDSGEETSTDAGIEFAPVSPETVKKPTLSEAPIITEVSRPKMVDSAMMTEPWEPESKSIVGAAAGAVGTAIAGVAGFALGHSASHDDDEAHDKTSRAIAEDNAQTSSVASSNMPGEFIESEPASKSATPKLLGEEFESKAIATPEAKKDFADIVSQDLAPVTPVQPKAQPLSMATFSSTHTEPVAAELAPRELPQFAMTTLASSHTEPVAVVEPIREAEKLSMSTFSSHHTEPLAVAPIVKEPEKFSISQYSATHTEPVVPIVETKKPEIFSMSTGPASHTEPVAPVAVVKEPEVFSISTGPASHTEPVAPAPMVKEIPSFAMSPFKSMSSEPVMASPPEPVQTPSLEFSSFTTSHTEPRTPSMPQLDKEIETQRNALTFSTVRSQHWEPVMDESLFSPSRNGLKRDDVFFVDDEKALSDDVKNSIPGTDGVRPGAAFLTSGAQFPPRTSSRDGTSTQEPRLFGGAKGNSHGEPTLVFADENDSTPHVEQDSHFRQPFAEVSNNVGTSQRSMSNNGERPAMKRTPTSEMGTQTMVSSDEIDKMMRRKTPLTIPAVNIDEGTPLRPESPRRASETPYAAEGANIKAPRRPASSGSMHKSSAAQPPLPPDHTQRIAAAAGARNTQSAMPPPPIPTGSLNKPPPSLRSRTPSISKSVQSGRGTVNRALAPIPAGRPDPMSPTTRASSISSFVSEVDERIQPSRGVLYPEDMLPATDPRMIQAITQTMIGEYLWKYTRKAGRSEISASRHRRFFWVHPYTRTLYWSEHDPSTLGKQQSKAKSVAIEAVRVITDDNAYPPGLHRKSLVIVTPGREIVFTAPTAQRHETWFNALSYLLLRTGTERENEEMTQDMVDEFNPTMRSQSRNTVRTRVSLSSYNSRTTRNSSPHRPHASEVPSLANRQSAAASQRRGAQTPGSSDGSQGRAGIMGGLFKSPGGSAIGTGLFLGLGSSLQTGGPLGALLGYAFVGLIVCAVQFALGEVTALLPVTGSFIRHAEFLVDPALGFAIGWNTVYGNWLSIPSEISAICVLFQYWTDINASLWIVIFILLTFVVGIAFVGIYGEIEFAMAMLKIALVVGLVILGLCIDLGGVPGTSRIGFRFWVTPGPFFEHIASGSWGNFLGFWSVMINAVFSFSGVESIAMAAAETRNPRQNIPKACKRVFARVALFYVVTVLIVGMLVPSDDERLSDESGTAAQSPFVIAASAAGIKAIPSIVNAVVITSAWSSSNQALLAGTRVLYSLALKKQAPAMFLRTTSWGVPYMCVLIQTLFMFLAFMSLSSSALTVFYWFVDLVGCGVLISWSCILTNHLRLMSAMKKQGIERTELPWHNRWTPYSSAIALAACLLILLTNGFAVFTRGGWSTSSFVSSYLDIPLILVAYLGWKYFKGTKFVALEDIPIRAALDEIRDNPETPEPVRKGWKGVIMKLLWE
ncbi:amino acid permease-like protein, partial [Aureobasidium melanogenum]